jgi:hypothetical protein
MSSLTLGLVIPGCEVIYFQRLWRGAGQREGETKFEV